MCKPIICFQFNVHSFSADNVGFEANPVLYNLKSPYFSSKTVHWVKPCEQTKASKTLFFLTVTNVNSFSHRFILEFFKISMTDILTSLKSIAKTPLTAAQWKILCIQWITPESSAQLVSVLVSISWSWKVQAQHLIPSTRLRMLN